MPQRSPQRDSKFEGQTDNDSRRQRDALPTRCILAHVGALGESQASTVTSSADFQIGLSDGWHAPWLCSYLPRPLFAVSLSLFIASWAFFSDKKRLSGFGEPPSYVGS
eukprot:1195962-Prorocentrum_minimum.AAC.5